CSNSAYIQNIFVQQSKNAAPPRTALIERAVDNELDTMQKIEAPTPTYTCYRARSSAVQLDDHHHYHYRLRHYHLHRCHQCCHPTSVGCTSCTQQAASQQPTGTRALGQQAA